MKTKSQFLALLFSSILLPALGFGQTVITYTTTGVLQKVTGPDKLGLSGSTITVTNTLNEGESPTTPPNQYTTTADISDPNLFGGTELKVSSTVTINYIGINSPQNSIAVLGTDLGITLSGSVFVPSISSISPEPIASTALNSTDTFTISDSTSSTLYNFSSGTISSVPPIATCSFTVAPATLDFPVGGSQQIVTVNASLSNCQWSAVSNDPWITVSPATGTGTGTVTVTVGPNATGAEQIGTATIGQTAVNITQDGPLICTYTVSPLALAFPYTGGSPLPITVTTSAPSCTWTASSTLSWLIVSPASGTGNGTVLATALPNPGTQPLSGTFTVAGQTVAVSEASTNGCSFTVAPSSLLFISNGGSQPVTLVASSSNCLWTASFLDAPSWITVIPTSGSGSATVTVTAAGNSTGGIRNSTLELAGQVVPVQQSNTNACTFTATTNPSPLSFVSSPSVGYLTVVASGQSCPWSISAIPDWLVPNNNVITYTGSYTVTLTAFANTATGVRTGVLTAAGITFNNVTQNGTTPTCNFTVSQNPLQFSDVGGSLPLTLGVSSTSCAWTATSSSPTVIVTPSSGTGPPLAPLTVTAASNATNNPVAATLTIGGLTVTVNESATGCLYTLPQQNGLPFTLAFPSQGGTLPVPLTSSSSSCAWTATSTLPWLTFSPSGMTGSGSISAIAATNLTSATETGTVTIAGIPVTVTVAPSTNCTFSVPNGAVTFPNNGGSSVASVIASGVGCQWTASAPSWVTLSATGGSGSSSILLTVASDQTGPTQSGNVIIAGYTLPVTQTGGCTFTISPSSIAVDVRGILQPITVTTSGPSCIWTATPPTFATLTADSGTGTGSTTLTIPPNATGTDLTGTLTIAGQNISVIENFTQQIFTDVPPGSFYFDAVNLLSQKGITSGCGPALFCPNSNITRAEMSVFIVTAAYDGQPFTTSQTPYFADVPVGSFGFDWIQKMYELGLTAGCGNGDFCPNEIVTRDQSAIFLIKARYGASTVFDYPPAQIFNDVPPTYFAYAWIQRMSEDGITSGCGNNDFCPLSDLTRGEIAIFIMRAIYNSFAAPTTPEIISVVPNVLVPGTQTVTITGLNTAFFQGSTLVSAIPGVTISAVVPTSATTLTATMTVLPGAIAEPYSVYVITGTQEEVLPFGITIP